MSVCLSVYLLVTRSYVCVSPRDSILCLHTTYQTLTKKAQKQFIRLPRSPQWMDLYQIWFKDSLAGNVLQSGVGFRLCMGSKIAISNWLGRSLLTLPHNMSATVAAWPVALFLLLLHPRGTLCLLTFDCAKTFWLSNATWKPIYSNSVSSPVLHQAPLYLWT